MIPKISPTLPLEDVKGLNPLQPIPHKNSSPMTEQTATEFGEMFVKFFFSKIMPDCEDGYFGTGNANDMYKSFWIDAVSKQLSSTDPFGIVEEAKKHIRKQEGKDQSSPSFKYEGFSLSQQTLGGFHDITL